MPECPRDGNQVTSPTKEWKYSAFDVKRFDCNKCGKSFKAYYRNGKLSHTIPKGKK